MSLKPSQVLSRIWIKLGKGCKLGVTPSSNCVGVQVVDSPSLLDFDSAFLARFQIDELMSDNVCFLHSIAKMNWKDSWEFDDKTPLWNFNLHYFEYLFPLVHAWRETSDERFLNKTVEMISGWIEGNNKRTKNAWSSYTISLRIVAWISYYSYVNKSVSEEFRQQFLSSLHQQYVFLLNHLEKDILGNHYFENLKSIVIASAFFNDDAVFKKALKEFEKECREQILADGMHFELSPMYHKVILEGVLRVSIALKSVGRRDTKIESYLQSMTDVAYSFEYGLKRLPLFNDAGNNVAKSLHSLMAAANESFGITPNLKKQLVESGYYFFEKKIDEHIWKLIVDAGQPGPRYIAGHAHCDAMSFELFCDGMPVLVNCGTYAYQCAERSFFRSTSAHNTVMIDGIEQSQCWGVFRLARRSKTGVIAVSGDSITMEMKDQKGHKVTRNLVLSDSISIVDFAKEHRLESFIHGLNNTDSVETDADFEIKTDFYAEEFGIKKEISTIVFRSSNEVKVALDLKELANQLITSKN